MTYHRSEAGIRALAELALEDAKAISRKAIRTDVPADARVPIEYALSREEYRVFTALTAAVWQAGERHLPAEKRLKDLHDALAESDRLRESNVLQRSRKMLSKDTQVQIAKLAVEAITGKTAAKKPFPDRAKQAVRKLIRDAIKENECLLMQSQWTHNLTKTKIGTAARLIFDGAVEAVKEAKKAKAGTELDLFRKAAAKAGKKTGKAKKAAAAPKAKRVADVFAKPRKDAVKTNKKK